jgi:hypothetical protein
MPTNVASRRARLTIDVEPELRRQIKVAAAQRDQTVREYVITTLRRALDAEPADDTARWGPLSARSFARDWDSQEDAVYDDVSPR